MTYMVSRLAYDTFDMFVYYVVVQILYPEVVRVVVLVAVAVGVWIDPNRPDTRTSPRRRRFVQAESWCRGVNLSGVIFQLMNGILF